MASTPQPRPEDFAEGRPVVFRNAIVIPVDAPVILDGDVLIKGETIEAVRPKLQVPEGTLEIDAKGGILVPGFVDTHRHMWQTALRGYGGDWALSQYFVFYYLQHGEVFPAGGHLRRQPAERARGRWTPASPRRWTGRDALRTTEFADAAMKAFEEIPGRFVLGYGNYLGAP